MAGEPENLAERSADAMRAVEKEGVGLLRDFKTFILRGNVVDLAVGIVVGAAFTSVVNGFVTDVLSPVIGVFGLGGTKSFATWNLPGPIPIHAGAFINAVVSFLIVAAVVFFFVVRPINFLVARTKNQQPVVPTTRPCPYCTSEISMKASRCPFCTSEVPVETGIKA